jgi:hypothetical protein
MARVESSPRSDTDEAASPTSATWPFAQRSSRTWLTESARSPWRRAPVPAGRVLASRRPRTPRSTWWLCGLPRRSSAAPERHLDVATTESCGTPPSKSGQSRTRWLTGCAAPSPQPAVRRPDAANLGEFRLAANRNSPRFRRGRARHDGAGPVGREGRALSRSALGQPGITRCPGRRSRDPVDEAPLDQPIADLEHVTHGSSRV